MARTPFRDIQQIASATIQTPYTTGTGLASNISVVSFTNTSATDPITISIYHNDGTTDFLKHTLLLPAGVGKERQYYGFERSVIAAGDSIKVLADVATAFNMFIYGSEVEI